MIKGEGYECDWCKKMVTSFKPLPKGFVHLKTQVGILHLCSPECYRLFMRDQCTKPKFDEKAKQKILEKLRKDNEVY